MKYAAHAATIVVFAGCTGPVGPPASDAGNDTEGTDTLPVACEARPTDAFVLGIVMLDEPRRFRPFDPACETIEVKSGIQGGWHIEPALQAPSDAVVTDLGGEMTWAVYDAEGKLLTGMSRFEMFRSFWQDLGGGYTYWGDFVIFEDYPEHAVDQRVRIELTLDFDDDSGLEDRVVEHRVTLQDLEAEREN